MASATTGGKARTPRPARPKTKSEKHKPGASARAGGNAVARQSSLLGLSPGDGAAIVNAAADISWLLDRQGNVVEVVVASDEIGYEGLEQWIGKPWIDTVTVESRPKIESMLHEAVSQGATRWRQVNHPMADKQADLPVQYRAVRLGQADRILAVGRELRAISTMQQRLVTAQQLIEREYRDLRHSDLRYRMLFQLAGDAVLIIEMPGRRVTDSNPAALKLFGRIGGRLNGRIFPFGFSSPHDREVIAWLQKLQSGAQVEDIRVVLRNSETQCILSASLFRQDRNPMALLRVRPVDAAPDMMVVPAAHSALLGAADVLPDALLVTESDGRIVMANATFLEMAQLPGLDRVIGENLERWLGRPGVDLSLLMVSLAEKGSASLFATILRSEFGSVLSVEASATVIPGYDPPRYVFSVRDVGLRLDQSGAAESPLNRSSVENLTELVGRVPLKEIVRETDDMIERMCIDTALRLAGDNRALAAEMLGVSRQSLYVKMRRFGLGDLDGGDSAAD